MVQETSAFTFRDVPSTCKSRIVLVVKIKITVNDSDAIARIVLVIVTMTFQPQFILARLTSGIIFVNVSVYIVVCIINL